jgi:hypothetical protein
MVEISEISKAVLAGKAAMVETAWCQGEWWWEMVEVRTATLRTATLGRVAWVANNKSKLGMRVGSSESDFLLRKLVGQ